MAASDTAVRVGADQVRAFRLTTHNLTRRRPLGDLLDASGACAVQNSPPGAAALALHARLDGFGPAVFDRAVAEDKSLLQTWCMRGSPFVFPARDLDVFTTGLLPAGEAGLRAFVFAAEPALDRLAMSLGEAVDRTEDKLPEVLSGTRLAINELGRYLAEAIAPDLPAAQRAIWQEEGPYAAGQPFGEGVVHFALRISTLRQTVCLAPRSGNKAPFTLLGEWLPQPPARYTPDQARRELLRRYLHCYGPSTPKDFAAWSGIPAADAEESWRLLADELQRADFDGTAAWFLAADTGTMNAPGAAQGVRLLPSGDPYIQQRDRTTIVGDTARHRELWRRVGSPGALLVDGRIAGIWNARKQGKRVDITVRPFEPLSGAAREAVDHEAQAIAPLRGASRAEVSCAE